MKCLITGGAGFIGSHIVDALVADKHSVIILDNLSSGQESNINRNVQKFYKMDLENVGRILPKHDIDLVIHCAAQKDVRESISDPVWDLQENVSNSLCLLEAMVAYNVKKIVFLSTGGALYGDGCAIPTNELVVPEPISPYGIAKWAVEKYLEFYKQEHGIENCILRFSNVYGPRNTDGVISIFKDALTSPFKSMCVNGGDQTRDFIHVFDVVEAIKKAMTIEGTYNVGTGEETAIAHLALMMIEKFGKVGDEADIEDSIKGEVKSSCLDASKLRKKGWEPKIKLEKGLDLL